MSNALQQWVKRSCLAKNDSSGHYCQEYLGQEKWRLLYSQANDKQANDKHSQSHQKKMHFQQEKVHQQINFW